MKRLALAAWVVAGAGSLAGADVTCAPANTITAANPLPVTIARAGQWCLGANLSWNGTGGSAITITTSDVTLDLNGFRLTGGGVLTGTDAGISASNRRNVTVRNGTLRGFSSAVVFSDTSGGGTIGGNYVLEDLAIDTCGSGITFAGTTAFIRRNRVSNVASGTGIAFTAGRHAFIADNVVTETATAISVGGQSSVVRHNRMANHAAPTVVGTGIAVQGARTLVLENTAELLDVGITVASGVSAALRDNVALGCTRPYLFGTTGLDYGNNK